MSVTKSLATTSVESVDSTITGSTGTQLTVADRDLTSLTYIQHRGRKKTRVSRIDFFKTLQQKQQL